MIKEHLSGNNNSKIILSCLLKLYFCKKWEVTLFRNYIKVKNRLDQDAGNILFTIVLQIAALYSVFHYRPTVLYYLKLDANQKVYMLWFYFWGEFRKDFRLHPFTV